MGDIEIMIPEEYGSYTIARDHYKTEEEFWKAISDAVRVHVSNGAEI